MDATYAAFLARKAPIAHAVGIDPGPMPDHLFDFQADCVRFALRQGRAAMFLDTGLGKTRIQLEWCKQASEASNGRALILTPLAVARQIEREGLSLGYNVRVIRSQDEARDGINICNYDRLAALDTVQFGAVSLDECFAKGTQIDTLNGKKHIEDIRKGDYILNCAGVDVVSDTHRREVQYAIVVKISGSSFIASPNHPIFTQRGWVGAQHLLPGDHALATGEAVRLVRGDILPAIFGPVHAEILRDIMLSEMANDAEGNSVASAFCGVRSEEGRQKEGVVSFGGAGGAGGTGSNNQTQPIVKAGGSRQDLGHIESHEACTIRAWGEWSRDDIAASIDDGCAWERMDSGISVITGPKEARIPHLLQDRLRQSAHESRNRGGWAIAPIQEGCRSEEGCDDSFVRVDGIEVLEPGDHRLEQLRDADGKLYFYDLGATRHPSYSVNGVVVHNSSILKNFTGATTRALIASFSEHRFRLCATATPAPNDHMELGTHSDFLGAMRNAEMLSRWFINDTSVASQNWRLKGHAVEAFWDWVASWSRCAETPADLGHDASRFALPPMNVIRHKAIGEVKPMDGMLFIQDLSATNMHDIKRQTSEARAEVAAALVNAEPDEPWLIWVDTDYEAAAVSKRLPSAVEVNGSHTPEIKENRLIGFASGEVQQLLTKTGIAGMGMNYQHCARMVFVGRSFSYESWYQAVRRCWRFGQTRPVDVHIVVAEGDDQIGRVIDRKAESHNVMRRAMASAMARARETTAETKVPYIPTHTAELPTWLIA